MLNGSSTPLLDPNEFLICGKESGDVRSRNRDHKFIPVNGEGDSDPNLLVHMSADSWVRWDMNPPISWVPCGFHVSVLQSEKDLFFNTGIRLPHQPDDLRTEKVD
jgi:hypothetical protein